MIEKALDLLHFSSDKFTGRRCNTTESSYYCAPLDYHTYEAESSLNAVTAGQVLTREATYGRSVTWTGEGFIEAHEHTNISFSVNDLVKSGPYNIVIRYEMEDVSYFPESPSPILYYLGHCRLGRDSIDCCQAG